MEYVDRRLLYQRLKTQAFNSSHYVWLWSDLKFLQSKTGWIFAITKEIGIHLIALEPLPPEGQLFEEHSFIQAFEELLVFLGKGSVAFVAINTPFAKMLTPLQFQSFQIGKEPWANLADIKPTGHVSRKIRVPINQSTKAGLRIEEWKLVDVLKDQKKLTQLNELKRIWEEQSFIALSGFLHGMSFESIPEDRRCFVALSSEDQLEGILITTPIVKNKSWYFEDTIIRMNSTSHRGVGELLTLQAKEILHHDGFSEVSLGIVPMTSVGVSEFDQGPPSAFLKMINSLQYGMGFFYNAAGLELFRKRFKLDRWDKIYLSVLIREKNSILTFEWIKVLLAIGLAYKPRFQLKPSFIANQILTPLKHYSISIIFIIFSILFYYLSQSQENLSQWLTDNAKFSDLFPLWLWPIKTFTSTFLYLTNTNFLIMLTSISVTLLYIEKEAYARKWTFYAILIALTNDAIIRTLCGFTTFYFPDPNHTFQLIKLFPMSGGSILLATLLGFSTTFVGQKKDKLLTYGFFAFLSASIFSPIFHLDPLNSLLHAIFYVEGFLFGRIYTHFQSQKDQLISKNKKENNGKA